MRQLHCPCCQSTTKHMTRVGRYMYVLIIITNDLRILYLGLKKFFLWVVLFFILLLLLHVLLPLLILTLFLVISLPFWAVYPTQSYSSRGSFALNWSCPIKVEYTHVQLDVPLLLYRCLYFVGLNFHDFCEFDNILKNISMKILTLCTSMWQDGSAQVLQVCGCGVSRVKATWPSRSALQRSTCTPKHYFCSECKFLDFSYRANGQGNIPENPLRKQSVHVQDITPTPIMCGCSLLL